MNLVAPDPAPTPPLRLDIRPAVNADMPYVVNSWHRCWRDSSPMRRMRMPLYDAAFDEQVRHGVLGEPDTRIIVGACANDSAWIWSWLCYTPGLVPTVHYAVVRNSIRNGGVRRVSLRRLGLFTRLVAAAGVSTELAYTFTPLDSHVEHSLLAAARAAGITARSHPVHEFLQVRRRIP